jgi:tagaturonate epimerase
VLRRDQSDKNINPHLHQLIYVGYKIAAEMGSRYIEAIKMHEFAVLKDVTDNLYERHESRIA